VADHLVLFIVMHSHGNKKNCQCLVTEIIGSIENTANNYFDNLLLGQNRQQQFIYLIQHIIIIGKCSLSGVPVYLYRDK